MGHNGVRGQQRRLAVAALAVAAACARERDVRVVSRRADLVGIWQQLGSDQDQAAELDIRADGRMLYAAPESGRWVIMKLTYRVEGDTLISNQPSAPREERTRFALAADGTLELEFAGERTRFRRGPKR